MAKQPPKVTDQQRRYVDAYLRTGNKRQSAREAGYASWETNYYSIHRARGIQHELMSRAIENMDHAPITPGYVLANLQEVVARTMAAEPVRDRHGNLVKAPFINDEGETEYAVLHTFDARAAIAALTKLGEHVQLFTPQKEADADQDARSRTVEAELRRIANALEGRAPKIEAAPVKTAPEKAEQPARRLN
jgi:DNA repair ATPase RecN